MDGNHRSRQCEAARDNSLLESQWPKLPNQALDRTAISAGSDGSKCRAPGRLFELDGRG